MKDSPEEDRDDKNRGKTLMWIDIIMPEVIRPETRHGHHDWLSDSDAGEILVGGRVYLDDSSCPKPAP